MLDLLLWRVFHGAVLPACLWCCVALVFRKDLLLVRACSSFSLSYFRGMIDGFAPSMYTRRSVCMYIRVRTNQAASQPASPVCMIRTVMLDRPYLMRSSGDLYEKKQ